MATRLDEIEHAITAAHRALTTDQRRTLTSALGHAMVAVRAARDDLDSAGDTRPCARCAGPIHVRGRRGRPPLLCVPCEREVVRMAHTTLVLIHDRHCLVCDRDLAPRRRQTCSDACRMAL